MDEKPKIKIELTKFDLIVEIISVIFLLLFWFLTISGYPNLPEMIPINYNFFTNEVYNYEDKSFIFLLPITATVLYVIMIIQNKFPHIFNYSVDITPENALQQYTMVTKLIRFTKLNAIITLSLGYFAIVEYNNKQFLQWIPLVIHILVFIPILVYFIAVYRSSKKAVIEKVERRLYYSILLLFFVFISIIIMMAINHNIQLKI